MTLLAFLVSVVDPLEPESAVVVDGFEDDESVVALVDEESVVDVLALEVEDESALVVEAVVLPEVEEEEVSAVVVDDEVPPEVLVDLLESVVVVVPDVFVSVLVFDLSIKAGSLSMAPLFPVFCIDESLATLSF